MEKSSYSNGNHSNVNGTPVIPQTKRRLQKHHRKISCLAEVIKLHDSVLKRQLVDAEEEFLHAAEFGDVPTVKRIVERNRELNVDCIDALGRTALRLAVKNEHLEVGLLLYVVVNVILMLHFIDALGRTSLRLEVGHCCMVL